MVTGRGRGDERDLCCRLDVRSCAPGLISRPRRPTRAPGTCTAEARSRSWLARIVSPALAPTRPRGCPRRAASRALAPSSSRSRPLRDARSAARFGRAPSPGSRRAPLGPREPSRASARGRGDSCATARRAGTRTGACTCVRSRVWDARAALMATVGGMSLGLRGRSDRPRRAFRRGANNTNPTTATTPPRAPRARTRARRAIASAPEADPWEGAYVKPALTVPEYIAEVRAPTPPPDRPPRVAADIKSAPERPRALATESTCCSECFHCQTNIAAPFALRARRSRRSAGRPSRRSAAWRTA